MPLGGRIRGPAGLGRVARGDDEGAVRLPRRVRRGAAAGPGRGRLGAAGLARARRRVVGGLGAQRAGGGGAGARALRAVVRQAARPGRGRVVVGDGAGYGRATRKTWGGGGLRDRLALAEPPVQLYCPTRGCLLCGIDVTPMPAIEVVRRGGPEAAAIVAWQTLSTSPAALGGEGRPQGVDGHTCPSCARAVDDVGSVGPTSRNRALVAYVRRTQGDAKAERLRQVLSSDFPPVIPGWGALPRTTQPNLTPWEHVRHLLDHL